MGGTILGIARSIAAGFVVIPALGLSGCGFQPLYGDRSGGNGVAADIAAISVAPIADRSGQILRNALIDRLTPSGEPADPRYALEVRLSIAKQELGIRKDETATRTSLRFRSTFRLRDTASGAFVFSSRAAAVTSYNIVDSEYGTIASERAARRRGLILVADSIVVRLAAYFNRLQSLRRPK